MVSGGGGWCLKPILMLSFGPKHWFWPRPKLNNNRLRQTCVLDWVGKLLANCLSLVEPHLNPSLFPMLLVFILIDLYEITLAYLRKNFPQNFVRDIGLAMLAL